MNRYKLDVARGDAILKCRLIDNIAELCLLRERWMLE